MRFPRNAKLFRGQLEAYPIVGVLMLLFMFVLLHSAMVFTPGVPINLPEGGELPGLTNATVAVAVDARGLLYYQNQLAREADVRKGIELAVARERGPVTLVLMADRLVPNEVLVRLVQLGRSSGVRDAVLATRPASRPGGGRPP
jgi:biopolymer transport protein ExbD